MILFGIAAERAIFSLAIIVIAVKLIKAAKNKRNAGNNAEAADGK